MSYNMLATLSLSLGPPLLPLFPLSHSLSHSLTLSLCHSFALVLVVLAYYRAVTAFSSGGKPSLLGFYISLLSGCA